MYETRHLKCQDLPVCVWLWKTFERLQEVKGQYSWLLACEIVRNIS